MVESRAGNDDKNTAETLELNGLGERRLPLADVVRFLGNEGVGGEVVRRLVTATQLMESPDEQLPLIPRELITLAEASARYSIPHGTLNGWVQNGRLPVRDREPFAARGGGKVLVDAEDIEELIRNKPQPGRPRTRKQSPNDGRE